MNSDRWTTLLGLILAALVAANVDYSKALAGDKAELGKIIGAVVIAFYGWLTNKREPENAGEGQGN